jgi:hypothetical protein
MTDASDTRRRISLHEWVSLKAVLAAVCLAELFAWLLLRIEVWRKLGLGWQFWQFWLLVVAAAGLMTLAAIAGACFIRRRMQFGLRTLLLLFLLTGTGLGLISIKLQSTAKQRRAAAALEQIGAGVSYAGEDQPGLLTFLGRKYFQEPTDVGYVGVLREDDLANIEALTGLEFLALGKALSDDDLAHLAPLKRLRRLALIDDRVTGYGLQHLQANSDLRSLTLFRCSIGDEGLRYVGQLRTLTDLNLNETRVTDAGLVHLAGLSELRVLYLDRNAITGKGLVHLRSLPHLEELSWQRIGNAELTYLRELTALTSLHLTGTSIDEDGVEALCGMSGLQILHLERTGITEEGIQRLRRALPRCVIAH